MHGSKRSVSGVAIPAELHSEGRRQQSGRSRVAALEDKIVQRSVSAVLGAIYEEEFLGFSYGFRLSNGVQRGPRIGVQSGL